MPKKAEFFQDIRFFEAEFDGIMPVEIVVDSRRRNGILKPATLRRMDQLGEVIRHSGAFPSHFRGGPG